MSCVLLFLLVVLSGAALRSQEPTHFAYILPVKAEGRDTAFFQNFLFWVAVEQPPGFATGDLEIGGPGIQRLTVLVPRTETRVVQRRVVVYENGRRRVITVEETITETIYVEETAEVEITLPEATGRWKSFDISLFSLWNVFHLGPDGLIIAAGTTTGEQLRGGALYIGVAGIPPGFYQLSTGEPGIGLPNPFPLP
jgi:hypothetical protein